MARAVNQAGIDLIKRFEGLRTHAYKCPADKWTIGWGHTRDVHEGDTISIGEAEEMLADDMADAGEHIGRLVSVPLNENEYAALVSFVFNLGAMALATSTLRQVLNE